MFSLPQILSAHLRSSRQHLTLRGRLLLRSLWLPLSLRKASCYGCSSSTYAHLLLHYLFHRLTFWRGSVLVVYPPTLLEHLDMLLTFRVSSVVLRIENRPVRLQGLRGLL